MESTKLTAAGLLVNFDYSVIPSGGGPTGKAPLIAWEQYQHVTPELEDLQAWEQELKPSLWGVVTGAISCVVIIDIDKLELRTMFDEAGLLPHIQTPRGGFHYWFKHPGHQVKTVAGLLPGIDIRGDGGFVNVIGKRKDGEYRVLIPPSPNAIYPWEKLPEQITHALDGQRPQAPPIEREIIPEHKRNATLTRLAGSLRRQGLSQEAMEAALQIINAKSCKPPLEEHEVANIARSIAKYPATSGINHINNATVRAEIASKQDNFGTTSGQDRDRRWGFLAKTFNEIVSGAGGPIDKREVAGTMGVRVTDDSFRKLLFRRMNEDHKVRAHRGSPYLIEWIRRDYKVTDLTNAKVTPLLDVRIALSIHELASVPEGSIMVVAGVTSAGKTGFLLETAELNVFDQPRQVYYWYNEMSEGKMMLRCEDFPLLRKAQAAGKFFPVRQGDFEFHDVLMPDALNLIDYIDRDEALYLIGDDLRKLYQVLATGWVCVAIQKRPHADLGAGGGMSIKLANNYVTLDVVKQTDKALRGKATIKKAKDWAADANPNELCCFYETGGKHGKLLRDSEWGRKE